MPAHNLHTLYTAQYGHSGPDVLDVTVKGQDVNGKYFAPTWDMVMNHKKGFITDAQYVEQYIPILVAVPIPVLEWFFSEPTRTLACFCGKDAFCHRNIIVNYFIQVYGGRIKSGGFRL